MDDLIKRENAIKAISVSCGTCLARSTEDCDKCSVPKLCGLISAIPSADRPKREWIPCSERLPSEQGQYLVTFLLCNGDPWVYVLSFCKGKFYETDDEWGDVVYDDIVAWMPLPKPYGEREGE